MKKKTIPLPCTEEQFKEIKFYCLVNGYKYSDLTNILVNSILKENIENGKIRNNDV